MSYFDALTRAVNIMKQVVPMYVHKAMKAEYGENALETAQAHLKNNKLYYQEIAEHGWDGLNLLASLILISKNGKLFKKHMGDEACSYCQRMIFYRNLCEFATQKSRKEFDAGTDALLFYIYIREIALFCLPMNAEASVQISALAELPEVETLVSSSAEVPKLTRGMRGRLSNYCHVQEPAEMILRVNGSRDYDFICFGLDSSDKIYDNRYIISHQNQNAPSGEIVYSGKNNKGRFIVNLPEVPDFISRLVFAVYLSGSGTMNDAEKIFVTGRQQKAFLSFEMTREDFKNQNAVIALELYRRDREWKFWAVGNGFDGGLHKLLSLYGGEDLL